MSGQAALAALATSGKAALAEALTRVETGEDEMEVVALLDAAHGAPRGTTLGLTGPPGVGKSTLTGALIRLFRASGARVAVIAVDPSSARSGGAFLGDRTRIERDPADGDVFVRSMAARTRLGGVADLTYPAVVLMRALFDWVIVETVGVGQSETGIAEVADQVLFCAQPGSGDAVQYMKAGVMEVPDLVVVTKGDMGALAERAASDLSGALSLQAGEAPPPVLVVSAETGQGLAPLAERLALSAETARGDGSLMRRRAAQDAAWLRSRLKERFGTAGLTLAAGDLRGSGPPFHRQSAISRRLETAFQRLASIP
ncbi:MAG: methylmalonyl Co-A mutase-associated GTPase MeaB [Pseudomonadota bacterium]